MIIKPFVLKAPITIIIPFINKNLKNLKMVEDKNERFNADFSN